MLYPMRTNRWTCVLLLTAAGLLGGLDRRAAATQPPRPGELERYRADGTLARRQAAYRARGNYRVRPDLAARAIRRLQQAAGLNVPLAPLPAWAGMPTTGTNEVLIFLIQFPDYAATETAATVEDRIFGDGEPADYPAESLTAYYDRSSYGQLHLQGSVLGWHTMAHNRSWYTDTYGEGNSANYAIIQEVVDAYDAAIDYGQFDNDGDKTVDYFAVVWTGPHTGWSGFWWGYQWVLFSPLVRDGVTFSSFSWQWESNPVGTGFDPSVIIHETGHALGLPDYYDYDASVGPDGGVGGLDMMDATRGDHNAFSKFMLDWLSPAVITGGVHPLTLRAMAGPPDAAIAMRDYPAGGAYGEYFLVENRHRVANDTSMPTNGLLVWHVDATPAAGGQDFLYDNSYTAHKLLRLMEADGLEEIETGDGNGDAGDYYQGGGAFTPLTTPDSSRYAGPWSFVSVTNISPNGTSMTTTVSIEFDAFPVTLGAGPSPLTVAADEDAASAEAALQAWVNAAGSTAYTVASTTDWISVSPPAGSSAGTAATHTVTLDLAGLARGTHTGTVWLAGAAVNSPLAVPVVLSLLSMDVGAAVDAPHLVWRSGGDAPWTLVTDVTHDGTDAARAGAIGDSNDTWFDIDVEGPGLLRFWWRASSEAGWDILRCYADDDQQVGAVSGITDWQQVTHAIAGTGPHTLRWIYRKDSEARSGDDTVWVDQVEWLPDTTDTDTDGMPDWQEGLAGTDPTNGASLLHVTEVAVPAAPDTVTVSWSSASGRVYSVHQSTNLAAAALTVAEGLPAGTPLNTYTAAVAALPVFFRITAARTLAPETTLLDQSFTAAATPVGWTVLDHAGSGKTWAFNNPGSRANYTGGSGNFAVADSDAAGESAAMDTDLVAPVIDC